MPISAKERENMSATAQAMLREYAAFRWPLMNHKGRMSRLADKLGFTHRRVRSLYRNEPGTALRADEMQRIEALRNDKAEEANRNDFQALQDRVARLEAALLASDQEFHFEQMAGLSQGAHVGRRSDVANPSEPGDA